MKIDLEKMKEAISSLPNETAQRLYYDWYEHRARAKQQIPSGDWSTWLILAGRGWGKTLTAAQWINYKAEEGKCKRIAIVAPTSADCRDVMVLGESGIIAKSNPWFVPEYESSKRRVIWPNGTMATLYSAEEPDRLNGPQHDTAWSDEIGVWRYARETWDMLQFGLRLGRPQQIVTTTPKVQNVSLIKEIIGLKGTVLVTGSTYENRSNLSESFFDTIIKKYEGTRIGQQELYAHILEDVPGALWTRALIENARVQKGPPHWKRVIVGIDPAVTASDESDETGIVAAGIDYNDNAYVIADITCRTSPKEWATKAINLFHSINADRIVAEVNNGGDLVETVLRTVDENIPYKAVHASRGKRVRAEPIASLYEQGRVHHIGVLAALEDQMCSFTSEMDKSPDRVDALVWALTELMLGGSDWSNSFTVQDREN